MKNFKNYLVIFLFIIPLIFSGCSIGKGNNQGQENKNQNDSNGQQNQNNRMMRIENENLSEGSIDDLKVGAFAMIMGMESEDGSIIANQIIIGTSTDSFNILRRGPMGMGSTTDWNGATGTRSFNREQFQNMNEEQRAEMRQNMGQNWSGGNLNEEERVQMRENMMNNMSEEQRAQFAQRRTSGGTGNGQGQNNGVPRQARASRLNGEIIDVSDNIITLKLEDGGSKLVFFSDKTFINVIKKKEAEQENIETL